MPTRDLTPAVFKPTIDSHDNVLVYFWAPKCGPCEVFTPTYEASSNKHFDVVHGKVNMETQKELVEILQVTLMPTLMAYRKGKLVFKQGGIADAAVMDNLVQHLRTHKLKNDPAAERPRLI
ncbi:thioredoxin family protein [Mycobacterium spongiae]|uniref:Thioredoxin n=1 Tax=Mycobacterium spongiae TaxID=886343 RepID=A0A975JX32_9MYCO|nr:thioredoxin family protein [Mycobacterium spongiae]QUR67296.1 thioredoxin [Mycobacterium spongiae]